MTHKELQTILKEYRLLGYTLEVKLNASTQTLETELDRLQSNPQICELTSAVRLPLVLPDVETPRNIPTEYVQEIKTTDTYWTSWNAAYLRAMEALKTPRYQSELDDFNSRWSNIMESKRTHVKPDSLQFGIIAIAVVLILAEIFYTASLSAMKVIVNLNLSQSYRTVAESIKDVFEVSKIRSNTIKLGV